MTTEVCFLIFLIICKDQFFGKSRVEKADGKRTTIELSVLRQEDKNYVKKLLAQKQEKPIMTE